MKQLFYPSKYEPLKTNKANVLACQTGTLPEHQKASIFQQIILFTTLAIGSIVLLLVVWSTVNFIVSLFFLFITVPCLYLIYQYFSCLTNPEINHIEGRISLLINPYRVKCQGLELVTSREIWLEVNPGESYRLWWYSSLDEIKHLIAFELSQTKPIREDTFFDAENGLVWSNLLGMYTNVTNGIPYSPSDEENYTPPFKHITPLSLEESQSIKLDSLNILINALSSDNSTERLYSYRALLTLGGEVVDALKTIATDATSMQQPVALWLLEKIAYETNDRLGENASRLLCTRCLALCHSHKVTLSWRKSIVYHGCRVCSQSRDFLNVSKIVVILDANMADEYIRKNDELFINWLQRRTLFDFDEVKIIQATDEEVERFIVQAENDTDTIRRSWYQAKGPFHSNGIPTKEQAI